MTVPLASLDPGDVPYLRMPAGPEHFRRRSARLGTLAHGHAAGDFLAFLAGLAAAQARIWDRVRIPDSAIAARSRPASSVWREALAAVLAGLNLGPAPAAAHAAVARLRQLPVPELEALALRVQAGELLDQDAALAPFVGAALQVVHTAIAARLPPASVQRSHDGGCPVCGSPPVAGVVLGEGGLRYLACSLCGSEWHRTRLQCAACGEGSGLAYFAVEQAHDGVKAEACSHCRSYLKLFYLEQNPLADPFADDVATLGLDLQLAGEGYARGGVSCFWA